MEIRFRFRFGSRYSRCVLCVPRGSGVDFRRSVPDSRTDLAAICRRDLPPLPGIEDFPSFPCRQRYFIKIPYLPRRLSRHFFPDAGESFNHIIFCGYLRRAGHDEKSGKLFEHRGLDPGGFYRLRLLVVHPQFNCQYFPHQNQTRKFNLDQQNFGVRYLSLRALGYSQVKILISRFIS